MEKPDPPPWSEVLLYVLALAIAAGCVVGVTLATLRP